MADEDETIEGQPAEEASGDVGASEEPGTEAEAPLEEESGQVTQDAPVEEAAGEGEEVQVPAIAEDFKPRSDIYSLILVLTFLTFATIIVLAGMEAHEFYDVQFWLFKKD